MMMAEPHRRTAPGGEDFPSPRGEVMELGMTFPLQRFVKRKTPACGVEPDRRFCWDLHVIDLRGRKCLHGGSLSQPVYVPSL